MKNLVIAEKPSVARDLAKVLGRFTTKEGYLENENYIVTWAIGHLVELAAPEDYNAEFKKWSIDTLPIMPGVFKLKPNPGTAKQFGVVKQLLNHREVAAVINACDSGREGELIFQYIYQLAGCQKQFNRLWLSETTPAAVKKAFASLRSDAEMANLAAAARARSQADWLIGINATRAFSVRYNTILSVGRVQTPTLALIVNREREIKNFTPTQYWELYAQFACQGKQSYYGKWFRDKISRFDKSEDALAVHSKVVDQPGKVTLVEDKEVSELPSMLFNLNDLQKEANKKFGLSAATTLAIAQALYETKKLLTYPRTDSRHLTRDLAETIPNRLAALSGVPEYARFVTVAQGAGIPGKRYVDDSKVSDHTALIPTDVRPDPNKLTPDERRIYDLVVRRFLAAFFPPARYRQTRVVTEVVEETFASTGRVHLDSGWKAVYDTEESEKGSDDEQSLPQLVQGEKVHTVKTKVQEKETKPPKRYTEASLLAVMEGAGRLIDDKELKEAMKGHGLGTPATRAAIIERLIKVAYIERQKKNLVPTTKAETLISLVPEIIKNPDFIGKWEKTLADIEAGAADPEEFMTGIKKITTEIVELTRNHAASQLPPQKEPLGKCPLCGKNVIEGSKGYGCSGYRGGCKFVIWHQIAGKKLSLVQAKTLLEKGQTKIIKGFKSKKGKKFDAALHLKGGKVEFLFNSEAEKQPLGKCPLCDQDVIEFIKGYGCNGYKEGCKFVIWKEICGKKITEKQVQDLLQIGKTDLIKDFKSKAGKNFNAILVLKDGKLGFEFIDG